MDELIAKLEAAPKGSRELDAEIAATLHIPPSDAPEWILNWGGPYMVLRPGYVAVQHTDGKAGANWKAPAYTTSLDAALTLVPKGLHISDLKQFCGRPTPDDWFWFAALSGWSNDKSVYVYCGAPSGTDAPKTAALALCIASLKARKER